MRRQLLFLALGTVLALGASMIVARSTSAAPLLYMSTNLQGYANVDVYGNSAYGMTGPAFTGDSNTYGGAGYQAGGAPGTGPAWNQMYDAAAVFQTPTPTPNGWTYGSIGGTNLPVNYPGAANYIAISNAQYDSSNTLTTVFAAINVNPPGYLNDLAGTAPSTLFDNEIGTSSSESAPGVLSLFNVPVGAYTLYAYTSGNRNSYDAELAVNGSTWQEAKNGTVGVQTTGTDYIQATATTGHIGNYVIFTGVVPVGGEIDIAFASGGGAAYLDGFQLVFDHAVPEPSSFVLSGIGLVGAGLLVRRRRK